MALSRVKTTVDLLEETNKALERQVQRGIARSKGGIIDFLDIILTLPVEIAEPLYRFCIIRESESREELKELYRAGESNNLWESSLQIEITKWQELAALFSAVAFDSPPKVGNDPFWKKITLTTGIVSFPSDYVVLNPEKEKYALFVCVIEIRNNHYELPHFVYFSDSRPVCDFTREIEFSEIDELILKEYPDYQKVIDERVDPICDREGLLINDKEDLKAPKLGYFDISMGGEKYADKGYREYLKGFL